MNLGLGLGLGYQRSAAAAAGPTLATLPTTPTSRWHPQFSTVSLTSGRVVSASDIQGLAGLTEGGAGLGPMAMTDANGRMFWRFDGAQWLAISTALAHANQNMSVFFVGRTHRASNSRAIYGVGLNGSTAINTAGTTLEFFQTGNSAPFWRTLGAAGYSLTNAKHFVAGCQLQVAAMVSRATAGGGRRLLQNGYSENTTQTSVSTTGILGGEIGRYPWSPGASGTWGTFDLYELVVYNSGLSDAAADAVQAALVANYDVVPITNQIVLDGDSITQGTGTVTSGISSGMILSEPGAGRIPAGWRVVNVGTSGNQVSNLVTKRDAVNGWPGTLLSGGQNVLAFEIGRNDLPANGYSAATLYSSVVAYLNTTTTGVMQRGWTVRELANIATAIAVQPSLEAFRVLIRLPQFKTDTLTNTGQAYDGKLSIINTDLIQVAGATIFEDVTDSGNTTYYQGDVTHPTPIGAVYRVTGADTPAYAIAYGL